MITTRMCSYHALFPVALNQYRSNGLSGSKTHSNTATNAPDESPLTAFSHSCGK